VDNQEIANEALASGRSLSCGSIDESTFYVTISTLFNGCKGEQLYGAYEREGCFTYGCQFCVCGIQVAKIC